MKKIMIIALALCLIVGIAPIARADLIAAPYNSFFGTHSDEMEYLYRGYYANGPEGYIVGWDEPDGRIDVQLEKNGTIILITYTIDWKGTVWGVSESHDAWIRMDELVLVYDYISFEEDHGASFHRYDGDLQLLTECAEVKFWPYPGAERASASRRFDKSDSIYIAELSVDTSYTDADGRIWLFINYIYGYRNVWVCMDDPANPALPANPAPMPDLIAPVEDIYSVTIERQASWNEISTFVLIGAMVLMTIAVTVLLIRLLGNKQK